MGLESIPLKSYLRDVIFPKELSYAGLHGVQRGPRARRVGRLGRRLLRQTEVEIWCLFVCFHGGESWVGLEGRDPCHTLKGGLQTLRFMVPKSQGIGSYKQEALPRFGQGKEGVEWTTGHLGSKYHEIKTEAASLHSESNIREAKGEVKMSPKPQIRLNCSSF